MSEMHRNPFVADESLIIQGRLSLMKSYQAALAEYQRNGDLNDGFQGLTPDEIFQVGKRMLASGNIWAVYDILAGSTTRGDNYYDALIAPSHHIGYGVLKGGVALFEKTKVKEGLDIAAGTGQTTLDFADRCECVTVIDMVLSLLRITKQKLHRAGKTNVILAEMDILKHGLPAGFFDVIISNGIGSYLTRDELVKYMSIIHQLLVPGGRYYECRLSLAIQTNPLVYNTSKRAVLAGNIGRCLSVYTLASQHHAERLQNHPIDIKSLGFEPLNYYVGRRDSGIQLVKCVKR